MSNACPLNFKQVDANLSRISALFVASFVLTYLYTSNVYILYFLVLDFVMKLFLNKGISPINILAEFLKELLKIKSKYTDGGAKRLAGFFGLFFVLLLLVSHYLDVWQISLVVAGIFLSCSLLDVFFNFCIGCKIYFIIKKIYPNFMNNL
jgi:hypothetical protein